MRHYRTLKVSYQYTMNVSGEMLEAGFAMEVPSSQSELRWHGQSSYAGYPGKDRQNEYGMFHLNRDDLYFLGNQSGVEMSAPSSRSGAGILMGSHEVIIALENKGDTTLLSHLALVPGEWSNNGSGENVMVASRLNATLVKVISGKFQLLPLSSNWPPH